MQNHHRPRIFGAGISVAVLSTLVLTAGLGAQKADSSQPRQPSSSPTPSLDRDVTQHLADLRKAAMSVLEEGAAGPGIQLESKSLLLCSSYEGGVFAGAPVSDATPGGSDTDSEKEDERVGQDPAGADLAAGDVLGMVLIAVSGVTEASSPTGGTTTTKANVPPGSYRVQRDTTGLQLVNDADEVVLSVPFTPPTSGSAGKSAGASDDPGSGVLVDGSSDWPRIYMAILHAIDPRFRM